MPEIMHEPKFWVAVSFALFVALAFKKGKSLLLGMLDARSAKIAIELEQARALRIEAERILADYQQKQAAYLKEATTMLEKARDDAEMMRTQAERDLKEAMDARTRQAMERIEQEETKAIADVRNHVVDIALAAARAIIIEQSGTVSQDELVKLALSDIERKIH